MKSMYTFCLIRFKALMSNVKQRKGRKMKKLLKSFKALMSNVKQQPVEDNNVVAEEFQSSNE